MSMSPFLTFDPPPPPLFPLRPACPSSGWKGVGCRKDVVLAVWEGVVFAVWGGEGFPGWEVALFAAWEGVVFAGWESVVFAVWEGGFFGSVKCLQRGRV